METAVDFSQRGLSEEEHFQNIDKQMLFNDKVIISHDSLLPTGLQCSAELQVSEILQVLQDTILLLKRDFK